MKQQREPIPSRYEPLDPRNYRYLDPPRTTLSEATAALGWIGYGAKQDEAMLWAMLVLGGIPPRLGAEVIGMPCSRLVAICYKWSGAGIYDYGSVCDLGWVETDPDMERMRRRAESAPKCIQDREEARLAARLTSDPGAS